MKRIISLILALLLVCGLIPTALADSGPAESSNLDHHWYYSSTRWSQPIRSYLAYENGEYVRAEAIGSDLVVEYYDQNFQFRSGKTIPLELSHFGGVRMDTDYNFVVVGESNGEEDNSKEVFRIIRYTKDWQRIDHASIYGANTTIPFGYGSLRFDRSGDILYIRTSHQMYTSEKDGLRHQANVMISLRVSDMTVTDQMTHVSNDDYGYVSHSFNQFIRVDGDTLLAVDHGDYYPRSVILFQYSAKAGSETFSGRTAKVHVLPITDSTGHYNDTGVSLGGFEFSSTDYLIAGSSYDQKETADLSTVHRNIFVTATPKDDFTDEGTKLNWITHYAASDNVEVSPPHFIKLDSDRFMLIWTENDNLKYCFVDGHGQLIGEICNGGGSLSDCVPIVEGDRVLWYVTSQSAPVFLEIDLVLPHDHHYCTIVTPPTCSKDGYTTYVCPGCGDGYVEPIPTTGHDWSDWYLDSEGSCTTSRQYRRDCNRCNTAQISSSPVPGHSWGDWYTAKEPTCTDPGFEQRDCSRCNDNETRELLALGHSWGDWYTAKEPTCTDPGFEQRDCSRCNDSETRELPALGHSWHGTWCGNCGVTRMTPFDDVEPGSFYETPVAWAVDNGITTGTSETTFSPLGQCQRAQVVTFLWRTAGSPEPTITANPFVDVSETDFYYKAVLWAVEKNITTGLDADHFGPLAYCNRAQVVTFLWRAVGRPGAEAARNPFADVKAGDFCYDAVLWAVEKGITNGLSSTEFGVGSICNRAQIVTFLYRTFV